jgi:HlyD family type I secretion membrane fusion protein
MSSQPVGSGPPARTTDQLPVLAGDSDWMDDEGPLPLEKPLRQISTTLFITLGVILAWSFLVPLQRGAVATGQLAPTGGIKVVQHLEGGIVKDILVSEGDHVQAGQILVRLAQTQSSASLGLVEGQYLSLMAQRARLVAEREGATSFSYPPELMNSTDPQAIEAMASERRLFETRRTMLTGSVAVLQQQIGQLNEQQDGLREQLRGFRDQLDLIKEEREGLQSLFEQGYASRTRILALDRGAASIQGSIGQAEADIARLEQSKGEAKIQMLQAQRTAQQEAAARLTEVEDSLGQSEERRTSATDIATRTEIRAPVSGTIADKQIRNPGSVIQPGQPLMSVVPDNVPLLAKIMLSPTEADNVFPGMKASIRLSGLDVQMAPLLNGKVTKISADAVTNEKTGQSYFVGEVEIDPGEIARLPKGAILKPGLPLQVMVNGGSRTFASYIVEPISNMFLHSFRN